MMRDDLILVTGGTGQQGGAVIRSLLQRGQRVRVLTRKSAKGEALRKSGVEVVEGDLTDRKSLDAALKGVRKVFLVTTPFEAGMEAEVTQGTTMADAAKAAGVHHLVFNSVVSADRKTGIPHFETKWRIEQHIQKTGIPATVIRPVFFMENFRASWMLPAIQQGKLVFPMRPDRRLQMVALKDIGEFVAAAFIRPIDFIGQTVEIAGDELTIPDALDSLSKTTGKRIQYEELQEAEWEKAIGHDFALMFRWFNEEGYSVDIEALQTRWGITMTKFRELISDAPWVKSI